MGLLLLSSLLSAQTRKPWNQPYGDYKLYHFGITVGMNFQDLLLTNSGTAAGNGETWYGTIPDYSPGFTVGLIADLFLNPYMNLRFTPMLCFGDKEFEFVEQTKQEENFKTGVRSNYLMIPLDLKIRSMRLNNYRPYVLAGIYSAVDLGRKKDDPILLKPMDYGISIGLGCDFYLPFVKVIPEIRFCFGLSNMLEQDRSDLTDLSMEKYSKALSKGVSRMIIFTFSFE
ncbi:MAG: PorT family protein [Dysgonamonadaceae bacterium]|nr:PorT family protein [Dysgonamonadaceae bacterium]